MNNNMKNEDSQVPNGAEQNETSLGSAHGPRVLDTHKHYQETRLKLADNYYEFTSSLSDGIETQETLEYGHNPEKVSTLSVLYNHITSFSRSPGDVLIPDILKVSQPYSLDSQLANLALFKPCFDPLPTLSLNVEREISCLDDFPSTTPHRIGWGFSYRLSTGAISLWPQSFEQELVPVMIEPENPCNFPITAYGCRMVGLWSKECPGNSLANQRDHDFIMTDNRAMKYTDGYDDRFNLKFHRSLEPSFGARCGAHNNHNIHQLNGDFMSLIYAGGKVSPHFMVYIQPYINEVIKIFRSFKAPSLVYVTGTDQVYERTTPSGRLPGGFDHHILFAPLGSGVRLLYAGKKDVTVVEVQLYHNNRSLAIFRLLPHYFAPFGHRVVCANRAIAWMPSHYQEILRDVGCKEFSVCQFNYQPVNCSFYVAHTGVLKGQQAFLHAFEVGGFIYGTDEVIILAKGRASAVYSTLHKFKQTGMQLAPKDCVGPYLINAMVYRNGYSSKFGLMKFSRQAAIKVIHEEEKFHLIQRRHTPSFSQIWRSLREKHPGSLRILTLEEYAIKPWSHMTEFEREKAPALKSLGPIVFFSLGSRGDMIPVEALARVLAGEGADVIFVKMCTVEEGRRLLACTEMGMAVNFLEKFQEWFTIVSRCPYICLAPDHLMTANALSFSLRPPPDLARPLNLGFTAGLSLLTKIIFNLNPPDFSIGAYADRRWWLPRSSDGRSFLRKVANQGTIPIGLEMGSSSLPIPERFVSVPLVPSGDHNTIMAQYEVIVTPGSAGVVQTAACAGCKVIVISDVVDRRYRFKDNPAGEVKPGADPRLILLVLAKRMPRLCLFYGGIITPFKWARILSWLLIPRYSMVAWNTFVVYAALRSSLDVVVYGPDVVTTLFMTITSLFLGKMATILLLIPIVIAERILVAEHDLSIYKLFRRMAFLLMEGLTSPFVAILCNFMNPIVAIMLSRFLSTAWNAVLRTAWSVLAGLRSRSKTLIEVEQIFAKTEEPVVFLGLKVFRLYGVIPLVHTYLLKKSTGVKYEGNFVDQDGTFLPGAFFAGVHLPFHESDRADWLLQTNLTETQFDEMPVRESRYGVFWNCQTLLLEAVPDLFARLTFGGAIILCTVMISSTMVSVAVLILFWLLVLFLMVPATILGRRPEELIPELAGMFHALDALDALMVYLDMVALRRLVRELAFATTHFAGGDETRSLAALDLATHYPMNPADPVEEPIIDEAYEATLTERIKDKFRNTASAGRTTVPLFTTWFENERIAWDKALGSVVVDRVQNRIVADIEQGIFKGIVQSQEWYNEKALILASFTPRDRIRSSYSILVEGLICEAKYTLPVSLRKRLIAKAVVPRFEELLARGLHPYITGHITAAQNLEDLPTPDMSNIVGNSRDLRRDAPEEVLPYELSLAQRVYERSLTFQDRQAISQNAVWGELDQELQFDLFLIAWKDMNGGRPFQAHESSLRGELLNRFKAFVPHVLYCEFVLMTWIIQASGSLPEDVATYYSSFGLKDERRGNGLHFVLSQGASLVLAHVKEGGDFEVGLEAALMAVAEESKQIHLDHQRKVDAISAYNAAVFESFRNPGNVGGISTFVIGFKEWVQKVLNHGHVRLILEWITATVQDWVDSLTRRTVQAVAVLRDSLLLLKPTLSIETITLLGVKVGELLHLLSRPGRAVGKVVWAPLFKREKEVVTAGDILLQTIKAPLQYGSPSMSLSELKQMLTKNYQGEVPPPLLDNFVRKVYRPSKAYGTSVEFEGVPNPPLIIDENGVLEDRVHKYLAQGAPMGIDGIWLYDDEKGHQSLSRYEPEGLPFDPSLLALTIKAADSIIEASPASFLHAKATLPETVLKYVEKAYSPGIPFIGTYRTRRELFNSPWADAIVRTVKECLQKGVYPDFEFHAFPKMQVVDKRKLLQGKAIRTVISEGMVASFIDHTLFLEKAKRKISSRIGMVSGVPLTENGLSPYFKRVLDRERKFKADSKEFDASTAPVLHEALAYIQAKGYEHHPNSTNIKKYIRQRYYRLQHARITQLSDGVVNLKNRGGATGQTLTAYDNSLMEQVATRCVWALVTGKEVEDFEQDCDQPNMADDNMWGVNGPFDPALAVSLFHDLFGMTVDLVEVTDQKDLEFLGRVSAPGLTFKEDYDLLNMRVPEMAIYMDPKRVLARRAAMTTRLAGFPFRQHFVARIQRTVGHALLTPHVRPLYDTLAREWMADAKALLKSEVGSRLFQVEKDDKGFIVAASLSGKVSPASRTSENTMSFLRKAGRLPSYREVMLAHVKPHDINAMSRMKKRLIRIGPTILAIEHIHSFLNATRDWTEKFTPHWLIHLTPESTASLISPPFWLKEYRIETFIFKCFMNLHKVQPTQSEFSAICKECPFRDTIDAVGFIAWIENPDYLDAVRNEPISLSQNYVILMVAVYTLLLRGVTFTSQFRPVARAFDVFFLWTVDLPKIYSVANLIYWVGKGRSSTTISGLMPRDPYSLPKKISRIITSITPEILYKHVPTHFIFNLLPGLVEWIAMARGTSIMQLVSPQILSYKPGVRLETWIPIAREIWAAHDANRPYAYLKGPTSVGKSTLFITALRALKPLKRIWLLVPRIINREEYRNYSTSEFSHRVDRSTLVEDNGIYVSTYGQFMARLGRLDMRETFLLLDEFHEGTPEMVTVELLTRGHSRLALSATPRLDLYPTMIRLFDTNLPRPFTVTVTVMNLDVLNLYAHAKMEHPVEAKRALLLTPGIRQAHLLRDSLIQSGVEATALTKNERKVSKTGCICATQVADSGLNISPGVLLGISSGKEVSSHRGVVATRNSTLATELQRQGRVGREANGFYYQPSHAGTGSPCQHYPSWNLFTESEAIMEHFKSLYDIKLTLGMVPGLRRIGLNCDPTCLRRSVATEIVILNSVEVYYYIMGTTGHRKESNHAYHMIQKVNVFADSIAPIEEKVREILDMGPLLPLDEINGLLESCPFVTMINGREVWHCGLALRGDSFVVLEWQTGKF